MASTLGYSPVALINKKKHYSSLVQDNLELFYSEKDNLELFYNKEKIPGGQIPNGPVFSEFIEQFNEFIEELTRKELEYPPDAPYPIIGSGSHGVAYLLTFGGQLYVLKRIILSGPLIDIQNVEQEIEILIKLIGKPFAVQLLGSVIKYNPPSIYNFGYRTGTAYLLYPFIPGMTLDKYQETYPNQTKKSIKIYEKIIDAVQALHDSGILHSDIKPNNIWIPDNPDISPFLLDFGVSQTLYNNDGTPIPYARSVGAMNYWSVRRMNSRYHGDPKINYPMTSGINWFALAKSLGDNEHTSPLNRKGRFKQLLSTNNNSTLTYQDLKAIIAEMKKNENPPSGGTRRYTKRNNKKTRKNKKIKKRN